MPYFRKEKNMYMIDLLSHIGSKDMAWHGMTRRKTIGYITIMVKNGKTCIILPMFLAMFELVLAYVLLSNSGNVNVNQNNVDIPNTMYMYIQGLNTFSELGTHH
ncbi:hypothetical protein F4703DRAFT_1911869, partial [Phycomyces blakesleeanus]